MRPEVLLLLGMIAAVRAKEVVRGAYNYHERVGIPEAERKLKQKKKSRSSASTAAEWLQLPLWLNIFLKSHQLWWTHNGTSMSKSPLYRQIIEGNRLRGFLEPAECRWSSYTNSELSASRCYHKR
ncbi:hypothetical protein EVAR_22564_1 [Eumeta japonica]|uniref:Secreted protein n=1 Tax=Eumeta variegata TaxID=151549 RepID=A0A4C1U7K7_EUMVA|nr:hypothetical protein EVAR_22564_1 [Eumeta japonica]